MKKRFFQKKHRSSSGKLYDSKLEEKLHLEKLGKFDFHDCDKKIKYVTEHVYNPDFTRVLPDGRLLIIESKGRPRDRSEMSKYIDIRKALDTNTFLIFVFEKPNIIMPFAQKRKDGTKQTLEEWADKNGFEWYYQDNIPQQYID